jgi:hypothetical protein
VPFAHLTKQPNLLVQQIYQREDPSAFYHGDPGRSRWDGPGETGKANSKVFVAGGAAVPVQIQHTLVVG